MLRQELAGLAAVITLGGASSRPSFQTLSRLIAAHPWIIATDADDAGDRAAGDWLDRSDRAIRVRPPEPYGKDWTEAHQGGLDLKAWWTDSLDGKAPGSIVRSRPVPDRPAVTPERSPASPEEIVPTAPVEIYEPSPSSDMEGLAWWSDEWRLRWSFLVNAFATAGIPLIEAREKAASQVVSERREAGDGPPPEMTPVPETAFWRDWLVELLQSGEAGRYLTTAELGRTSALLSEEPLDGGAIRSSVEAIKGRFWRDRQAAHPDLFPEPSRLRWRCLNPYCLYKRRWWVSAQGVINCSNCRPPATRAFVVAEGDAQDAPRVEPNRSN